MVKNEVCGWGGVHPAVKCKISLFFNQLKPTRLTVTTHPGMQWVDGTALFVLDVNLFSLKLSCRLVNYFNF